MLASSVEGHQRTNAAAPQKVKRPEHKERDKTSTAIRAEPVLPKESRQRQRTNFTQVCQTKIGDIGQRRGPSCHCCSFFTQLPLFLYPFQIFNIYAVGTVKLWLSSSVWRTSQSITWGQAMWSLRQSPSFWPSFWPRSKLRSNAADHT